MSKRTLRRAAERQAHKAEPKLQLTAEAAIASPVSAVASPTPFAEPDVDDENFSLNSISPELKAIIERHHPGRLQRSAEFDAFYEKVQLQTATAAQIAANRENAQLSTGPVSLEGKAASSQNRRSHGLAGTFTILGWENADDFQILVKSVYDEHKPATGTEQRLADSLIQHYWLTQRAIRLQEDLIGKTGDPTEVDPKKLSLFLRYQSTHERSYYKAEKELQNLKKQKKKDEIGFESQKRQQESHEARIRLTHSRASNLEIDTAARQVMEAPIPGNYRIPFEDLTKACSIAIANVVYENQFQTAAQSERQVNDAA